ncbi:MAG: efflux RND transporter periplasmic adaptor subunit [Chloroflexi bacterium]|nr:efflux RND transporter periplasmic adaptor subunit [Chloroflexota bacterium]
MRTLTLSQYLTLAAALVISAAGGYAGYQRFAPPPAAAARVTTADVTVGSIMSTVSATGSVASPAQSKLAFKAGGRLAQLLVSVGDQVAEGQPLARIDDADLQVALVQAQANYNAAVAKLQQTKAGSKPEDIRAAQAQVDAAKVKLDQARAVPQSPDVAAAQAQVESARIKLQQTLAGGRVEDVVAAQAQVDAANAKLQALLTPRPEDLAAAQSQVDSANAKLQALLNPRPEDVRSAEAALASSRIKLQALLNPRPEDLAAAQAQLDQQKTKLAQLLDQPKAKPEDIANAQLAVQNAQVVYDKALANAGNVGKAGGPATTAAADAAVKSALINLQTAQNNLSKVLNSGATDWDIRMQQEVVNAAQAALDKVRNPAPTDVQAAQAAVDQAQAQLDKIKNPSPFDVQAAQEAVTQAQAGLDRLRNPSPADVAAAQQAVVQAQASLQKLVKPSDYDVQSAQQALALAQAALDKLLVNNQYDVQSQIASYNQVVANLDAKRNGPSVQDIAVAMAAVDQADAQLKQAQANLAAATLTAPFAGVVSATGANLGEQVGATTERAAVTLVDTRQLRVDVVVDETDVAKMRPGQQVTLTLEALPDRRIDGTVAVVAPVATVQQGVVNYQVQIQIDPAQAQGIRPGMTATAQIVTAEKNNVVVVPNRAIKTQGRNRAVEVLDLNGKTEARQVQIGLANDQQTEIVGGLQPGERVVIPTTSTAQVRVPGFGGAPGGFGGGGFGGGGFGGGGH